MENQHRHISGYRELGPEEISVMNAIKAKMAELEALCDAAKSHLAKQTSYARSLPISQGEAELLRMERAEPFRWVSIARTHFQEGGMALTRAIAQPSTF